MRNTLTIFRRELAGYFATPVGYVFIIAYLMLSGVLTFYLGGLLEQGQANLQPFFVFHPWIYLFFLPAISMRLWSEERKSGSIELLLTLPVSMTEAVVGKFLAAWCFTGIALLLTTPVWLTVNYLGSPDNGVILASYLGSLLLAGGYLAIGSCISALTRNQVVAFVVSVCVCLVFVLAGYPVVVGMFKAWAPGPLVDAVASIGFLTHFEGITKGVIRAPDFVFFFSLIALWLFANAVAIDIKKAD